MLTSLYEGTSPGPVTSEALIRTKFDALKGSMAERMTRLWAERPAELLAQGS